MARILISAVASKSGGALTFITNLARSLGGDGHQYILLVPPAFSAQNAPANKNLRIVATAIGSRGVIARILWDQIVLRFWAIRLRADLLVSTSDFGMLFAPCNQVLLVRNALFFSDIYKTRFLPFKPWGFRLAFYLKQRLVLASVRAADCVITASQNMRDEVQRAVPLARRKTLVLPFGVPLEKFKEAKEKRSGSLRATVNVAAAQDRSVFTILYVTEYGDYKNIATLLRAAKILRDRNIENYRFLITVDPASFLMSDSVTRQEDWDLANDDALREHVMFLGGRPYDDIEALYTTSSVLVFPSLVESFGHPLIEAMAAGLPVITADTSVSREVCGTAALYFPPEDPQRLADDLIRLMSDRDLRERLACDGQSRAFGMYCWDSYVNNLVRQFSILLEDRPHFEQA